MTKIFMIAFLLLTGCASTPECERDQVQEIRWYSYCQNGRAWVQSAPVYFTKNLCLTDENKSQPISTSTTCECLPVKLTNPTESEVRQWQKYRGELDE